MIRARPLAAALAAVLAAACSSEPSAGAGATVRIERSGGAWEIPVEISADPSSRERGWMGRTSLPPDRGMLFLYPRVEPRQFWMKDCLIPIDAAFVDESGQIVNVVEMHPPADPSDPERYRSAVPVRIVLEMPGGWFHARGVGAGDRVVLSEAARAVVPR